MAVLWVAEWAAASQSWAERNIVCGLRSTPAAVVCQFVSATVQCRHHYWHQCFHDRIQVCTLWYQPVTEALTVLQQLARKPPIWTGVSLRHYCWGSYPHRLLLAPPLSCYLSIPLCPYLLSSAAKLLFFNPVMATRRSLLHFGSQKLHIAAAFVQWRQSQGFKVGSWVGWSLSK